MACGCREKRVCWIGVIYASHPRWGKKGDTPSAAKPDFSNVQSSASTVSASAQTYTVVAGDSLSKIAKHFYGNANAWKQIFEANRDKISNPDMIHPGQVLSIPAAASASHS